MPIPTRPSTFVWLVLLTGLAFADGTVAADQPGGRTDGARWRLEVQENSVGMRFVRIPAGEFLMGSPENELHRFECERQHRVRITKEYWLGIEEVTNAQFRNVMGGTPRIELDRNAGVRSVSWYEAEEFCRKLSELETEKQAGRAYRLPTEAEWEYACRAGTKTTYSWGDDPTAAIEYAWCLRNMQKELRRVGSRKPNPWGLYDMHGGGWEWCSDWFAGFTAEEQIDPQGPSTGEEKVLKGGALNSTESYLRCAARVPYETIFSSGVTGQNIGVRVILIPPSEAQKE